MNHSVTLAGEDLARVRSAIEQHLSANTRRMYRTQWNKWETWALDRDLPPVPATPDHVAAFLADIARASKPATVNAAKSAIAAAHRLIGEPNPCEDRLVSATVRGLVRSAAKAGRTVQRQARAIDDAALEAIRRTACLPRTLPKTVESVDHALVRGKTDIAMIQVMRDAGLRRGELAALTWADVERMPDGSGRLRVRRSKTDQAGTGAVVAVTARAMLDLDAIRTPAGTARVFRMAENTISRRVKAAARAAGLGEGFSGHSGRVGMARRMVANGAPTATVQRQGRWRDTRMIARYTRNESAAEALNYL